MFSEELLFSLNEYELIEIANQHNIPTTIGKPATKKRKITLATDVYNHIDKMKQQDKKEAIRNITTTGRLIFTAFRTIKRNAKADYIIPKNYIEYKDTTNNLRVFLPENIDEMIDGYFVIIPTGTSNHIYIIKKDFGSDIGYSSALSMARSICIDMQLDPLFNNNIVTNIFTKIARPRLNTDAKHYKSNTKSMRVFYDQHKCDGEFLTISTRVASGRPRIGKFITRLSSIEQQDIDSLVRSNKINLLTSSPAIVDYAIINTPPEVRESLVAITVNVVIDNASGAKNPIRYKLSIHKQEIKVLTVDTNFNDIKAIVDIILEIH